MKLGIASDHNGVDQKRTIIDVLQSKGYEMIDYSPENYPTDDYPDFAKKVAEAVQNKDIDFGILLCGTGIGMSIAANKFKGIRCAAVSNVEDAFLTRNDNDSNIITISFRKDIDDMLAIIEKFITTPFSNDERHIRRVNKIAEFEGSSYER